MRQSWLALEFFNRLISHCDLNQTKCLKFSINLWNLAQKNQTPESERFGVNLFSFYHFSIDLINVPYFFS